MHFRRRETSTGNNVVNRCFQLPLVPDENETTGTLTFCLPAVAYRPLEWCTVLLQLNLEQLVILLFYSPKEGFTMTRSRRQFTAQQKLAVVRRHLVDKTPVSDLCDELGLQPTQIYTWQKQLFENGDSAFIKLRGKPKQEDVKDKKIAALDAKIQLKNEVVAELLQEHVQLKKELWEP